MKFERDLFLTTTNDIDVTTLSYNEMMHYMKHNIFIKIGVIIQLQINKFN